MLVLEISLLCDVVAPLSMGNRSLSKVFASATVETTNGIMDVLLICRVFWFRFRGTQQFDGKSDWQHIRYG